MKWGEVIWEDGGENERDAGMCVKHGWGFGARVVGGTVVRICTL